MEFQYQDFDDYKKKIITLAQQLEKVTEAFKNKSDDF
jgi:hypothetical protein